MSRHISPKTLERYKFCNTSMAFLADATLEKKKQVAGNSCNNRFCPICSWRQAKKDAMKIAVCMRYIENALDKRFISLTLTAPNVSGEDLSSAITEYNNGFKRLFELDEVDAINAGYVRKLEITYNSCEFITDDMFFGNSELHIKPQAKYFKNLGLSVGDPNPNYNTFHPHFHVIVAVNRSYFTSRYYISQARWLHLWRASMRNDSISQVNVRAIEKDKTSSEVQEIAKYTAKHSDLFVSQAVFDIFYKSMYGRQLLTFNKAFKEAVKLFKAGDLDVYKDVDDTDYYHLLLYRWCVNEYKKVLQTSVSKKEKESASPYVDEMEID